MLRPPALRAAPRSVYCIPQNRLRVSRALALATATALAGGRADQLLAPVDQHVYEPRLLGTFT